MHKIINLGTGTNNSAASCCPVDASVVTYFNIVADNNITNLEDFTVFALLGNITKAIAAYDCAGLDNYTVTKFAAFTNRNIWIYFAVMPYFGLSANIRLNFSACSFRYGSGSYEAKRSRLTFLQLLSMVNPIR